MATSAFLHLPSELREIIYCYLFSSLVLENQTCRSFRHITEDCFLNNFTPSPECAVENIHAVLLTCHQCYDEGVSVYYRQAVVHNATEIMSLCQPTTPSYRTIPMKLLSFYKWLPAPIPEYSIPAGTTCNIAMVAQYSRHFIMTSEIFRPLILIPMQAIRTILIKMPEREWYHWPALQDTLTHVARPSSEELATYHAGVLPSTEPTVRFRAGLLKRTHTGHQSLKEDILVRVMNAKPGAKFTARIPVRYRLNHVLVHEICEYNLRTQQLISREVVSEDEIRAQAFPEPDTPNSSYYNSFVSDYQDSWEEF